MVTLYEGAFAKVNLTLDVLGKRPDGYHDVKSVMQSISIRDDIEIDLDTGRDWEIICSQEGIPCDERNLAWKAAKVFFDAAKIDPNGITIRITKRIPAQAGLGGGSADAGAVLRALNKHYANPFSILALAELGGSVGSDVPFCTLCGTAMAEGRGERLRKLPDMPDCIFVVVKPEFSASTPELYRKLDENEIAKQGTIKYNYMFERLNSYGYIENTEIYNVEAKPYNDLVNEISKLTSELKAIQDKVSKLEEYIKLEL
jgi:4-diphosphocytidyl-2-C-methyl-D-erythritol kinase